METNEKVRIILGAVIVCLWISTIVWDATHPDYDIPSSVTSTMALVAAWIFTSGIIRHRNGKVNGGDKT